MPPALSDASRRQNYVRPERKLESAGCQEEGSDLDAEAGQHGRGHAFPYPAPAELDVAAAVLAQDMNRGGPALRVHEPALGNAGSVKPRP